RSKGSLTTTKSKEVFQARFKAFVDQYYFLNRKIKKSEITKLEFQLKTLLWILKSTQYGIVPVIENIRYVKRRKLKFINIKMFNPFLLIRRFKVRAYKRKEEKRYIQNNETL